MNKEAIRSLVEYHFARHNQLWTESVMTLSDVQFLQDVAYSHGSLRNQWVHMMDDDAKWLAFLQEQPHTSLNPDDFVSRSDVAEKVAVVAQAWEIAMQDITDTQLQKVYRWDVPIADKPQYVKGWQVMVHVVNHGTDHRAQVLRILHDLGAHSFDQDLMGYWLHTGQLTNTKK